MFAHCLMILCICTKICENILKCFRVIERTQSAYSNLPRGHNYVKTIGRVIHPFSAYHLMTFYICTKFQENSRVIERIRTELYKGA